MEYEKDNNKEKFNQALANFIREVRIKRGLTQSELAEKLQIDNKHLSRLENTNNKITFEMFLEFCQVLSIDISVAFEIVCSNYKSLLDEKFNVNSFFDTKINDLTIDKKILVLDIINQLKNM